ncbi:MAG: hypothetical protein DWQ07_01640 [Chloroflexi bacterium]|nr:MAG: hypothetical protein DWQ07_01640 [Chloroflexota bacterium]MBL1193800.1 hypothetical protein [Chloroflexota bacterium]NOH11093.1 hypothetical protein [Chloroflexota bacterium]
MLLLAPVVRLVGFDRAERVITWPEKVLKEQIFGCRMCGQCILHSTGMTCPMTCPKNIRNGPCGGVRADGHCEVKPEMVCMWVDAFDRSQNMPKYGGELIWLQPPLDRQLEDSSSWINMIRGVDEVSLPGWDGELEKEAVA